ncbi:hypothetical protein [Kordia jejudonensis]|uniref:hypothetical protein n=1 Tax=Kordia jejudonensis TaxID=1348245 RepID=UPI0006293BD1|nr:hypothetical protein [Kordia jejudonensis]
MNPKEKTNENSILLNVVIAVFTMFLVVRKNYFNYYKTKAIIGLIGGTTFFIFFIDNKGIVLIITALILVSFLEITDHHLWKYPPFSWMYIVKNFSGTYKGRQLNMYFSEFKESFYKKEIFKECRQDLELTIVIHQTGSKINVNFFYYDTSSKKSSKHKCDQVIVSKTDDDQHYMLTCHYGDIGTLEKGGHHETMILKFIKRNRKYHIEGGCYDNRKLQARGKFVDIKKVSSSKDHPF